MTIKITELPAITEITSNDVLPIVDISTDTTKKVTIQQISDSIAMPVRAGTIPSGTLLLNSLPGNLIEINNIISGTYKFELVGLLSGANNGNGFLGFIGESSTVTFDASSLITTLLQRGGIDNIEPETLLPEPVIVTNRVSVSRLPSLIFGTPAPPPVDRLFLFFEGTNWLFRTEGIAYITTGGNLQIQFYTPQVGAIAHINLFLTPLKL